MGIVGNGQSIINLTVRSSWDHGTCSTRTAVGVLPPMFNRMGSRSLLLPTFFSSPSPGRNAEQEKGQRKRTHAGSGSELGRAHWRPVALLEHVH